MYRIKYWHQETMESGRWCTTGTMSKEQALKMVELGWYENAEIIKDEEYVISGNCIHRNVKNCEYVSTKEAYKKLED